MRQRIIAAGAAASACLALAACGQSADEAEQQAETAAGPLAELQELEASTVAAIAADDVDAAVAHYAEDVRFIAPGAAPAIGISAVRASFERIVADPSSDLVLVPGPIWIAESGELAVTNSQYYYSFAAADGPEVERGFNQSVWRRDDQGNWKIVAEVNAPLPEASADAEGAAR